MTLQVRSFTRWALWMLPVWAGLLFLSTLTHQPEPQTAFAEFSAYITTSRFLLSHLIGSILGAAIGSIGAIGLMLHLQDSRAAGKAITGMVAAVTGNTFTTAVFGAAAFAQPAIGRMFLSGHSNAQEFYNQVYAAPLFGTVLVGLVLMIVGGVFSGIAVAASGRLPLWAGWLYAISVTGFIVSSIFFQIGQTLFSTLLIVASIAVAWSAGRERQTRLAAADISPES